MFYWFFEAQTEPALKPLVIWLHGGPGCSSVAFGAAQEIGPFLVRRLSYFTNRLTFNEYSWNKVANVLFPESPVSIGFSYTNNTNHLPEIGDQVVANDTVACLLGWFKRFPDFKSHDFYIIGESYGGHYAPQLADLIYKQTKELPNTRLSISKDSCYVRKYFNQKEVQRALHANVTNLPYPYTLCNSPNGLTLRRLCCPPFQSFEMQECASGPIGLTVMEEWRPWFYKRQVAGWVDTYGKGLTLATIRGGGHEAALSARDWSLSLFTNFLSNSSLPSSSF
ncbi:hypothetical protein Patl1_23516 [Pistacia atlantica]|uniref:Uncharacterized protein n=1 Tax=Pistacia atlantica TaxID=434234 RepID=A0ACC1A1U7_9ROSI|nr:hypothetical protein Patl1_23516 [Pistacia atlantica]